MTALGRYDPLRALDWRIQRVRAITKEPAGPWKTRQSDDTYVRRMVAYRCRWQPALGDEDAVDAVNRKFPECAIAQRLAEAHCDPESAIIPSLIEARLLAGQSYKAIAQLTGTLPSVIEHYEALYFHVTNRLDARDWMTTQVLVPALAAQARAVAARTAVGPVAYPFLDGKIKLFGYYCGPLIIDVLATGFESFVPIRSAEDLQAWYDAHWQRTIRRRSVQAAQTFEINKFNVTELFAVHLRLMDLEQAPGARRKGKNDIEGRIKAALDSLPYTRPQDRPEAAARSEVPSR